MHERSSNFISNNLSGPLSGPLPHSTVGHTRTHLLFSLNYDFHEIRENIKTTFAKKNTKKGSKCNIVLKGIILHGPWAGPSLMLLQVASCTLCIVILWVYTRPLAIPWIHCRYYVIKYKASSLLCLLKILTTFMFCKWKSNCFVFFINNKLPYTSFCLVSDRVLNRMCAF